MAREGVIGLKGTEPVPPGLVQASLKKFVSFSQVSSMFITRVLESSICSKESANCYLSTKHLSELALEGIFLNL